MADSATWSDAEALDYIASYSDLILAYGADPEAGRQHYANFGAAEGRTITFDPLAYVASYPNLIQTIGTDTLAAERYYIQTGYFAGQQASFDALDYIASYSDLIAAFGDNTTAAEQHYIQHGYAEGRTVNFDALDYIASYGDLIAVIGDNPDRGADHYIEHGYAEGRTITFDPYLYIAANPDLIAAFGDNPIAGAEHYIDHGYAEGRTTTFDALDYVASYGDLIAAIGDNPDRAAEHYIEHGYAEGRTITFDPYLYIAANPDLIAAFGDNPIAGAEHYIDHGYAEGRTTTFDALDYVASYGDLIAAIGDNPDRAAQHYIEHGYAEGRTVTFDPVAYLLSQPDLQAEGIGVQGALKEWIQEGYAEGRSGDSTFGHEQTSHDLAPGQTIDAAIDVVGDHDWYQVALTAGQTVTFDMALAGAGTADLAVHDASGHALATTDLGFASDPQESLVSFTAPTAGTYYVTADAAGSYSGDYTLTALTAPPQIGTAGDDTFVTSLSLNGTNSSVSTVILDGGAGKDDLELHRQVEETNDRGFVFYDFQRVDTAFIHGGDGNDVIKVGDVARSEIDAGAGDDLVTVSLATIDQHITLGDGADTLDFSGVPLSYLSDPIMHTYTTLTDFSTTVTDFLPGVDHLDLDSLRTQSGTTDIRFIQSGDDALLQGHLGAPGTTDWTTLITFEHSDAAAFTPEALGYSSFSV